MSMAAARSWSTEYWRSFATRLAAFLRDPRLVCGTAVARAPWLATDGAAPHAGGRCMLLVEGGEAGSGERVLLVGVEAFSCPAGDGTRVAPSAVRKATGKPMRERDAGGTGRDRARERAPGVRLFACNGGVFACM